MTMDKMSSDNINPTSIIEGAVKFRDKKKWKSRWCVMRKLSPVADCVHLQLYRDLKERQKNGQTKASLSLQQFLGVESEFTLDKESNTLAILCRDVTPVLAFCSGEDLIQWRTRVVRALGIVNSETRVFSAMLIKAPPTFSISRGPVRLHVAIGAARICLTAGLPPKVVASWDVSDIRRYGLIEGRLCFEVGARGGRTEGAWALHSDRADKFLDAIRMATPVNHNGNGMLHRPVKLKMDQRLSDLSEIDQLSEFDSSIDLGESASIIDVPIDKHGNIRNMHSGSCVSCMNRLATRAMTPGSDSASTWATESINDTIDLDRTSTFSESSAGKYDYSATKYFNRTGSDDCNSPITRADNKSSLICTCFHQQNNKFAGAYENYDVPKAPKPVIQRHIRQSSLTQSESNYDVPKNIRKYVLNDQSNDIEQSKDNSDDYLNNKLEITDDIGSTSTLKLNTSCVQIEPCEKIDEINIINESSHNLCQSLEGYESSEQILRSVGFSQEEIDGLEDIPENEPLDYNNPYKESMRFESRYYNKYPHYMCMEPQDSNTLPRMNRSKILERKTINVENNLNRRKSSSAEFLKKAEEIYDLQKCNSHKDIASEQIDVKIYNDAIENTIFNRVVKKPEIIPNAPVIKIREKPTKSENAFFTRFRDSVKIRRSSSVPNKSVKNRDSSSSSDSGISTGSYKNGASDVEIQESNKAVYRSGSFMRNTQNVSHPIQQIAFQFHENTELNLEYPDALQQITRRQNKDGLAIRSPSSCGSETSDYCETLSLSSISSNETSNRSVTRPRSGREYSTIRRQPTYDRLTLGN